MTSSDWGFGTKAIHAGQDPDPSTGAIMTPVYLTSTYKQSSPGQFIGPYDYGRSANPTRTALETNLAALESAKHALCFSSGLASIDAVLHTLNSGDHILASDDVYGGTFRILDKIFKQLGLQFSMVDMTNRELFSSAFRNNTKLVWMETPTNPLLKIIDIELAAQLAHKHGSKLVVDNTFASPFLQNPIKLGADIVSHSLTKYLGGHSDIIGGALMLNDDILADKLRYIQNAVGAVPGPLDCFLVLRSTKTLHLRMERHSSNAMQLAEYLSKHAMIDKVVYPGLKSHPQHDIAKRQMHQFGGMITCFVKGGLTTAKKVLERVKIFSLAESLGGVESLIEHPAIMTHASIPQEQREAIGITDGLIRLSVGVEDYTDLVEDLEAALK